MCNADEDYHRLKRFMAIASEAVFGIATDSDVHPLGGLEAMEARSPARARQGVRMAVNDLIEATSGLAGGDVERWDAILTEAGAATLSEVRARFAKGLAAVVRRGLIRSETEYYLVRNAVDVAVGGEQDRLWQLLHAFEAKASAHG